MKKGLSVAVITKNASRILSRSLDSIRDIADEIVVVDEQSTDNTLDIAKKFHAKISSYSTKSQGLQKNYAVSKCQHEWILILDSDEVVSKELKEEIREIINNNSKYYGFEIPYQNHLFEKPLYHGGENYFKLVLFKKKYGTVEKIAVHERVIIKENNCGKLKHKIYHYSYQNLLQMFRKFTDYAIREAKHKSEQGERSSLRKVLMYAPHMFWARFIRDRGYKDGLLRISLDFGFAYMELLTYLILILRKPRHA